MRITSIITAAAFAALVSSPAAAVIFSVVSSDAEKIVISNGGNEGTIFLSDLRAGGDKQREDDLLSRLRAMTQNRQLVSTLPFEEPTKIENPGATFGERFFWCTADGTPLAFGVSADADTWVCAQADVPFIAGKNIDGSYILGFRSSKDCSQDPSFIACAP